MFNIFISYRREDSESQAERLFDALVDRFGEAAVFMDVSCSVPGRDVREVIDENVSWCGVLLAVIGQHWLHLTKCGGIRRMDDPLDVVRLETVSALKRGIAVIPVLVQGARMPQPEQLPGDLAPLARRDGVALTPARWNTDVRTLIESLTPA